MFSRLLLLSALAAFGSDVAYGLGLGELELNSALNQEFDAEIELRSLGGLEEQEIRPGLASQEDFERVGIERTYLLTDLRFDVVTNEDGNLAVHITSTRPIVEPYLNFLVEVLWPSGRILREYTVLLDPPVFGEEGVERIAAPSRQPASEPVQQQQTTEQPRQQQQQQPQQQPTTPAPEPPTRDSRLTEGSRSGDEYGMTGPGDTLWAIAQETRPDDSISVQQMMLALKRANPDAFINDNINLLKAGHVLRVPDSREIREETFESAVAKVQAENDAFESYRGGRSATQMDASPRQPSAGSSDEGAQSEGELRLLASDRSSGERAGTGGGNAEQVEALEDELSVAEEDLDRARRANTELNSRLTDLEDQIETLNEIVKLKDDQLAALRAEVKRMQEQEAQAPTPEPSQPATSGSLLTNPLVLGGLGVLVVLGAAGGMMLMRRRRDSEEDFDDEEFTAIAGEAEGPAAETDTPLDSAELPLEEEEEDVSPQTSDAISEAEIYIAYGRFPQAITFLQNAMENEPERTDIQLKLLEVYVQTEDATAFNLQLERLKALGDEDATRQALEMQKQIPGAAEEAEASMDATVVSSEPVAPVEDTDSDDDDDLSFDLDDLDAETEDDTFDLGEDVDLDEDLDSGGDEAPATSTSTDDDDDDFDLDLDLEADSSEDDSSTPALDDLDLELDDETSPDETTVSTETQTTASTDSDDEFDLGDDDFDLDLGDDETAGESEDDAISLDDSELDDLDLDSELEQATSASTGAEETDDDDDGTFELNLDDDDDFDFDFEESGSDETAGTSSTADSDDEFELDLGDDDSDDGLELNLDDDDDGDDGLELNLGDDDESDDDGLALDLDDDSSETDDSFDLGDDDDELNLDEDASTKLDLARAYIDMGDADGARNVLQEVVKEGDESEVKEANELLEKI